MLSARWPRRVEPLNGVRFRRKMTTLLDERLLDAGAMHVLSLNFRGNSRERRNRAFGLLCFLRPRPEVRRVLEVIARTAT